MAMSDPESATDSDPVLTGYHTMPCFDPYRADPRFQSLLAKMNLA